MCLCQAVNYKKQELLELNGETDKCKIIVGDFTTISQKGIEQVSRKPARI